MTQIPTRYIDLDRPALLDAIASRKAELAERLCILGHHYQSDDVIQFADFRGDSLKLSQIAAEQTAEYILFAGVHFMAESADILAGPTQTVTIPNLAAGCGMADMADATDVAAALEEVASLAPAEKIVPVTYVNSTAAIKAVTADWDGACCTSSNVRNVFESIFAAGATKIFAIPDQHLARNTAFAMGYGEADCVTYDPALPDGGLTAEQVAGATFILWKGYCYVHQTFTAANVAEARAALPDATVIVHPECPREVVAVSDLAGSTAQILTEIDAAPAGSSWVVGTEANLVRRLGAQHPDKTIRLLGNGTARCVQMAQIDLPHLLWCLDALAAGEPINVVSVDDATAAKAKISLQRMIDTAAVGEVQQIYCACDTCCDPATMTDEQWREVLPPETYRIARKGGTERAFTGDYWNCHEDGIYTCVCCGAELFSSSTKFDSGSGWPSFYDLLDAGAVELLSDLRGGRERTAVHCKACNSHLGHLFDDGPRPTGKRFCVNSASLKLETK